MDFFYKGIKVNYTVHGTGKHHILFLHGWGGSTDSFLGLSNLFADRFVCINLDFPPFGKSDKLNQVFDVRDYFEIVCGILNANNINEVFVVAHSFGARVAIMLAAQTDKVKKLIITGGAGIKLRSIKKRLKILKYKFLKRLVKIKLIDKNVLKNYGSSDYKQLDEKTQKTFVKIVNFNETNMLQYIRCETLLIWGEQDRETPMKAAKIFRKKIMGSALITFKDSGHFCYLENFNKFYLISSNFFGG